MGKDFLEIISTIKTWLKMRPTPPKYNQGVFNPNRINQIFQQTDGTLSCYLSILGCKKDQSWVIAWYSYQMVTQNMLRTYKGKKENPICDCSQTKLRL